jgi:photosystem II stability/assembly factor-like uncharacterized protein
MMWTGLLLALSLSSAMFAADETTPAPKPKDILANLKFRNLGPTVGGGRISSVVGIPGVPNIYYAGAAAGGIFKTIDGGMSWKPIFEKQPVASIGAIALAPSHPDQIWVGTGEGAIRNDVSTGHGVYFSPDAGTTWRFMGLADVGQIANVIVHPTNPNVVYVGAVGHAWAPNKDRGVFRTQDGGKTWEKVLYVADDTGIADMAMDPKNPLILYAATWQMVRHPWGLDNGGPNSAIYRSSDGGSTWTKLTEGLPKGPYGRIGLAVAPTNPAHVYALIEAKTGTLWESRDYGEHWNSVSDRHALASRGFYFSHMVVAPDDESRLYFLSFGILGSEDGGRTNRNIGRGVHPDHHSLWIDPKNPERMIEGNDGGVYFSYDGAKTWRFSNNLPIEQFYMVASDEQKPYLLCGGLQDNNGWCGPSNNLSRGGIAGSEWFTTVGGDGEYVVPAQDGSKIVYGDSQNGSIQRLDMATWQGQQVRPYLEGVEQKAPADLKYRFNWTSPIAVDAKNHNIVYLGGSALFKSTDGGAHWTAISGDLTRNDKQKQQSSGGQVYLDLSGAETFDTILSMSLSPVDPNVIWVGTDDGLVQVTKDGGKSWTNVTPKGAPEWCRIQQIDASPFSADAAHFALDCHEIDNNKAYVYKTRDFGKTWASITKGLPDNEPARVVREDPNHKGFLALGNEVGVYYSFDDGENWQRIQTNFPTVPIYDLKFVKSAHDLVVATHGRGLFVLDNIVPLEELADAKTAPEFKLFSVLPGTRWIPGRRNGGENSGNDFVVPNPPTGAVIQYYLDKEIANNRGANGEAGPAAGGGRGGRGGAQAGGGGGFGGGQQNGPVKLTVYDSTGAKVRTFNGPGAVGVNRVVWDYNYQEPVRLQPRAGEQPQEEEGGGFRRGGGGPPVVPGTYKVEVTANGKTETQTIEVAADPRVNIPIENFRAQTKVALELRDEVSALNTALNRVANMRTQIQAVQRFLATGEDGQPGVVNAAYQPVVERARALDRKLRGWEEKLINPDVQPGSDDDIHYLARFQSRLQRLGFAVSGGYGTPPNELVQEEMAATRKELDGYLAQFNEIVKMDVNEFNKLAFEKGANTLFAGGPVEIHSANQQAGGAHDEQ